MLLQRKHSASKAVLFDDVVIYISSNSTTDIVAPTAATSANATASAISWTSGTDENTGIQKTLIFKRTNGSADDLTLNDQGIYSLTPTEGPSTDQSNHWTLVAVVNGNATSYVEALDGSTRYAIVHRDLAYNYSTPTYVTTPSTGAYTITKSDHANGDFTISSSSANKDDVITLSATPNDGFAFNSWKIHKTGYVEQTIDPESNAANTTFTMPDFDVTVKAYFAAIPFVITHTPAEHGTYTIQVASEAPVSGNTVGYIGQTVYLVATPDDGYVLKAWNVTETVSGNAVTMISDNAFDMPTVGVTIAPEFEAVYTVTLNPNGGEIVDATGWTLDNGQYKKENIVNGTELALPTFTKTDNTFMTWRDGSGNEYNSPVTVNSDLTITAIWGKEIERIIYSWESPEGTVIETGGTATHYNGNNSVSGNTRVNYANTANNTTYYTICLNGDTDYSTDHIRFALDENIKSGDEVRVTAYCNKNKSAKASAKMNTQSGTNIFADNVNLPNIYSSGSPVLRTYIIPEGINTNAIKMTRNQTETATFITKLQIVRTEVVETVSGTITASGWNTFSSNSKLDLSTITGGKAYVATSTEGGNVTMTPVEDKIVAAGTGLMINGTAGETFTINTTSAAANYNGDNLLVGLPNGGTVTVAGEGYNYVFGWTVPTEPGFYLIDGDTPTLGANKAYLHTTTALSGKLNIIIDDSTSQEEETDGIKAVSTKVENGVRYNLAGQKVGKDYKGIVIVNGKKMLNK